MKYDLLNETITEIMQQNNIIDIEIIKINGRGVYTLNMLYDFWLIYVYQNDLIRDQYIYPDVVIHNLLYKLYNIYGASNSRFSLTNFLRMLGTQLESQNSNSNIDIKFQEEKLRNTRLGYQIGKKY